jgi:hypothetical protein
VRSPVPDLCADLRAWAASGYRTVPGATGRFVEAQEAEQTRPADEAVLALLRPLEGARARTLARAIETLHLSTAASIEKDLAPDLRRLAAGLGISQTPVVG